ncbi:MAG: ribosomal RNA small subunit methyltransferase A [Fimbriimonadaceae bacterium]|nr:ribosomal RNA small subunit methyltransferase A [Fimbriimonadaceae bacterium]
MGRRLGQHFLHDPQIAARIVAAAELTPQQRCLEIGPGPGALTSGLLASGAAVTAIELDHALAAALTARADPRLTVIERDVLGVRLDQLGDGPWVVVGNLPYYITSPILLWLCAQWRQVGHAVLMLQAELADRLLAAPGGKEYGRLTVAVGYRAVVRRVCRVPAGAFRPPPRVQSAVVRLDFRPQPAVSVVSESHFERLVEAGFRWRRKTLGAVLRGWLGCDAATATTLLAAAAIDPQRRAETLDLVEFGRLADVTAAR